MLTKNILITENETQFTINNPIVLPKLPSPIGTYLEQVGSVLILVTSTGYEKSKYQTYGMYITAGVDGFEHYIPSFAFQKLYEKAISADEPEKYDGKKQWISGERENVAALASAWVLDVRKRFPDLKVEHIEL